MLRSPTLNGQPQPWAQVATAPKLFCRFPLCHPHPLVPRVSGVPPVLSRVRLGPHVKMTHHQVVEGPCMALAEPTSPQPPVTDAVLILGLELGGGVCHSRPLAGGVGFS